MNKLTQGQQIIYCTTWAITYARHGDSKDATVAAFEAVNEAQRGPVRVGLYESQIDMHNQAVNNR